MIIIFGKWKVGNGLAHLLSLLNMSYILMDDHDFDLSLLTQADTILVSPGVKQSHRIYTDYAAKIQSELNFLWSIVPSIGFANPPVWVWITATNGKSTTTWITYCLFKQMLPNVHVWITWNFDIPISEQLATIIENNQLDGHHIFVVESSSFMLYGLQNFMFDYTIFLNIARDHLDWHRDWAEYKWSKFNLLKNTRKIAITAQHLYNELDGITKQHVKVFSPIFELSQTKFLWAHNQENFAAATLLIETYFSDYNLPFDFAYFAQCLHSIAPLDHRLKLLRTIHDINIYDDGICTSSQALHAALDSFYQPLVLIAGGYDKWDDYTWLEQDFVARVGYAVLFGQTAHKFQKICEQTQVPFVIVSSLHEAVEISYSYAQQHAIHTILFSPWAASFDMFTNVYDRVGQFIHEVEALV